MLVKILKYRYKIVFVIVLVGLLAGIRLIENAAFYDPFIAYFKDEFTEKPIPQIDSGKLFLSLLARYSFNSVISLLIIYVIFAEIEMIKFTSILYIAFFIVLTGLLFALLSMENPQKMYIFYVRRFLIQPIFLLLFVPAFYFQKLQHTK